MSDFWIALDKIKKFQVMFDAILIAVRWDQQILEFIRARVSRPKKNMIIVDAKSFGESRSLAYLSKCS